MSTLHPLPTESASQGIFSMLYGNDVEINPGDPVSVTADKCMVAIYVNDDDQAVGACLYDYDFAAFASSSLTGIPVGGAEDAAKSGNFSKMMLGNIQEVMNICSRLFMDNESPHLRLDKVYPSSSTLPPEAQLMLDACQGRVDYSIQIPGYGSGKLSFIAT